MIVAKRKTWFHCPKELGKCRRAILSDVASRASKRILACGDPFVVINVERRGARTGPVRRRGLCTKRRLSTVDRGRRTSQIVNPLLPALNPLALPAILTLLVATSSRLYWRGRGQGILRLSSTLPFHSAPFWEKQVRWWHRKLFEVCVCSV